MKEISKFKYNYILFILNLAFFVGLYFVCGGEIYIYNGKLGSRFGGMALYIFEIMVFIVLYMAHYYFKIRYTVLNLVKHSAISVCAIGLAALGGASFMFNFTTIIRIIMLVILVIAAVVLITFYNIGRKKGYNFSKKQLCKKYYDWMMPVVAIVGFVFAILIVKNAIDVKREYKNFLDEQQKSVSDTGYKFEKSGTLEEELSKLIAGNYENLSISEKEEVYKYLSDFMSDIYGTQPVFKVKFATLDNTLDGEYNRTTNIITLNDNLVDDQIQCIITLLHETYHAITNTYVDIYTDSIEDKLTESEKNLYFFKRIQEYRDEVEEYPNLNEPGAIYQYANLNSETDADAFALKYAQGILNIMSAMVEE